MPFLAGLVMGVDDPPAKISANMMIARGTDVIIQGSPTQSVQFYRSPISISAPALVIHRPSQTISGTGDIQVTQSSDSTDPSNAFHAQSVVWDMAHDCGEFSMITSTTAITATHSLFIRSDRWTVSPTTHRGQFTQLTTCDLPSPHSFLLAQRSTLIPNDRLILEDVWIWSPIGILPFGFWTPIYVIDLKNKTGSRITPVIGRNDVEGTFVKNTIEYLDSERRLGQYQIDWMEKKGLGLGIRHPIRLSPTWTGMVTGYRIDETDTGEVGTLLGITSNIQLSPEWSMSTGYRYDHIYLLNRSRSNNHQNSLGFDYTGHNQTGNFGYSNSVDFNRNTERNNLDAQWEMPNHVINWNASGYRRGEYSSDTTVLSHHATVGSFTISDMWSIDRYARPRSSDARLHSDVQIFHDIGDGRASMAWDWITDLEGTENRQSNWVERLPETQLDFPKQQWGTIGFTPTFFWGRYTEHHWIPALMMMRNFVGSKYGFQLLTDQTGDLGMVGSLEYSNQYSQFGYDTGDAWYRLAQKYQLSQQPLPLVLMRTTYETANWRGNSPFYFDDPSMTALNQVLYQLNIGTDHTVLWTNSVGTNFITQKPIDYLWTLNWWGGPIQIFLSSGYRFPENRATANQRFYDFNGKILWIPTDTLEIGTTFTYDLNRDIMKYLSTHVKTSIGQPADERWDVSAQIRYSADTNTIGMDTIEIIKQMHERRLTLQYNAAIQSFSWMLSLTAFPEMPIGSGSDPSHPFQLPGLTNASN